MSHLEPGPVYCSVQVSVLVNLLTSRSGTPANRWQLRILATTWLAWPTATAANAAVLAARGLYVASIPRLGTDAQLHVVDERVVGQSSPCYVPRVPLAADDDHGVGSTVRTVLLTRKAWYPARAWVLRRRRVDDHGAGRGSHQGHGDRDAVAVERQRVVLDDGADHVVDDDDLVAVVRSAAPARVHAHPLPDTAGAIGQLFAEIRQPFGAIMAIDEPRARSAAR